LPLGAKLKTGIGFVKFETISKKNVSSWQFVVSRSHFFDSASCLQFISLQVYVAFLRPDLGMHRYQGSMSNNATSSLVRFENKKYLLLQPLRSQSPWRAQGVAGHTPYRLKGGE
jgi:hypothetical protein